MRRMKFIPFLFGTFVVIFTPHLDAQSFRAFVSRTGNDTNSCTFSAPCRNFTRALDVTVSGGEIIVLDSAGYGPVTINKSVAITAPEGVYAGITSSSGNGITVSGTDIQVVLRGLTITHTNGNSGIEFVTGSSLVVDRCLIRGPSEYGIQCLTAGNLILKDTTVMNKTVAGVRIATSTPAKVSIVRSQFELCAIGVHAEAGTVSMQDCVLTGNGAGARADYTGTLVTIARSNVTDNDGGLGATAGATVRLIDTVVTGNVVGLSSMFGTFSAPDPKTNTIEGNQENGSTPVYYSAK